MRGLAARVGRIRSSPIRRVTALLEEAKLHRDIISFGGGAPGLVPPKEMMENAQKLVMDPRMYKYGSTQGSIPLRTRISEDLKKRGLDYGPEQIAITVGCQEAIFLSAMVVFNHKETAVLTDPCYLGYPEAFKMLDLKLKWIPLSYKNDFQPQQEDVDRIVDKNTKGIVMVSPDNPTGGILSKESTKMIADAAIDNDCYILFDETYKDIIFDKGYEHHSFAKYAPEHSINCGSFSKNSSIPGLRIGYIYAHPEIIDALEKLQQYIVLAPNTFTQNFVMKFFDVQENYLSKTVVPTYRKRRDAMAKCLQKYLPEAKFSMPHGSFYFFPNMEAYLGGRTEEEFSTWLMNEAGVVVIPGNYFGNRGGEGHIRMTFVSEPETRIEEGIKRISELVT
jgi:aspartate aminotransferase